MTDDTCKLYRCIRCDYKTPFKHNYLSHLSRKSMCEGTVPLWDEYIKFGIYNSYIDILEAQQDKITKLQKEKVVKTIKYYNTSIDQEIVDSILEQKDIKSVKNEKIRCLTFFSYVIHHLFVLTKCVEYHKKVKTEIVYLVSHKKQTFTLEEGTLKLFQDALKHVKDMNGVEWYLECASSEYDDFQNLEQDELELLVNEFKKINLEFLL